MARQFQRPTKPDAELPAIAAEGGQSESPLPVRQRAKKPNAPGKKLTLRLTRELDFRLENLATINGQHKAAFALKLIDQGCRGYKADINLKNVFAEISGQAGEAA